MVNVYCYTDGLGLRDTHRLYQIAIDSCVSLADKDLEEDGVVFSFLNKEYARSFMHRALKLTNTYIL